MESTDGSSGRLDDLLRREWLVTNHLGGYASSTLPGLNTRKYHGLLVAAMAPPVQRIVLLSRVEETVRCDGWPTPLACSEYPGAIHPQGHQSLHAFAHLPFPRWAYQGNGWTLEKSLQLLDGQNTVVLTYTLVGAQKPVELEIRPLLALRPIHDLMYQWNGRLAAEQKSPGHLRVPPTARTPEVFFAHDGAFDAASANWYFNTIYRSEQDRGYAGLEDLWSPGAVTWSLQPGQRVHLLCSADPIALDEAIAAAELQFGLDPSDRRSDVARVTPPAAAPRDADLDVLARAANDFVIDLSPDPAVPVTMVTKFPWSAPSVRDALIAFAGVLLVTGKFELARSMLVGLAGHLRNGMLPEQFPETASAEPVYAGADVSLWYVNAVWQYLQYTGDEALASRLLNEIVHLLRSYQHGGSPGIAADADGLLASHSPGRGTTWMDAKVGDWVVTPRAGRPVELNALWYNALRIAAELSEHAGQAARARELGELAGRVYKAFDARFWNDAAGHCYDVVGDHGPDAALRPNQLLALSLPFPVLAPERHAAVLERVAADLLTPVGPRTLAPAEVGYQRHYRGDVVSRDRACHNGPVHPWLLGAYVTAHVRVSGRSQKVRDDARALLQPCLTHMRGPGLGHLAELFEADAPHRPGGAIASAPAVGELLRCYVEDVLDQSPTHLSSAHKTPEWSPVVTPPTAATKR